MIMTAHTDVTEAVPLTYKCHREYEIFHLYRSIFWGSDWYINLFFTMGIITEPASIKNKRQCFGGFAEVFMRQHIKNNRCCSRVMLIRKYSTSVSPPFKLLSLWNLTSPMCKLKSSRWYLRSKLLAKNVTTSNSAGSVTLTCRVAENSLVQTLMSTIPFTQ